MSPGAKDTRPHWAAIGSREIAQGVKIFFEGQRSFDHSLREREMMTEVWSTTMARSSMGYTNEQEYGGGFASKCWCRK